MASARLVLVWVMLAGLAIAEEMYTTKFDHIDVDQILSSERLLNNYVKCILDKGKCSPDGKELKGRVADALETRCRKCSAVQLAYADKSINFIYHKRRADYDLIAAKYDPTGIYRERYEAKYLWPEYKPTKIKV